MPTYFVDCCSINNLKPKICLVCGRELDQEGNCFIGGCTEDYGYGIIQGWEEGDYDNCPE